MKSKELFTRSAKYTFTSCFYFRTSTSIFSQHHSPHFYYHSPEVIQNCSVNFRLFFLVAFYTEKNKISTRSIMEWKGHMTKESSVKRTELLSAVSHTTHIRAGLSMKCQCSPLISVKVTHFSVTSWSRRYKQKNVTNEACRAFLYQRKILRLKIQRCNVGRSRSAHSLRSSTLSSLHLRAFDLEPLRRD